jgi:hypothetical protein
VERWTQFAVHLGGELAQFLGEVGSFRLPHVAPLVRSVAARHPHCESRRSGGGKSRPQATGILTGDGGAVERAPLSGSVLGLRCVQIRGFALPERRGHWLLHHRLETGATHGRHPATALPSTALGAGRVGGGRTRRGSPGASPSRTGDSRKRGQADRGLGARAQTGTGRSRRKRGQAPRGLGARAGESGDRHLADSEPVPVFASPRFRTGAGRYIRRPAAWSFLASPTR